MEQPGKELVVDVGNSRMKLGLFRNGRLHRHAVAPHGDLDAVHRFLAGAGVKRIALGSVSRQDARLVGELERLAPVVVLKGGGPSPLGSTYTTPETLGVDRLANAVGASLAFPGRPVLAIDLGSCATYDIVDELAVHRGGIIAPGLHMRARAMHAFSALLPEVDPPDNPVVPGHDTLTCLAAGTFHGMFHEIRGHIVFFRQQYRDLAVVVTGGDAPRFVRALKSGIFAHPSLTLIGLHALLHYDPQRGTAPILGTKHRGPRTGHQ